MLEIYEARVEQYNQRVQGCIKADVLYFRVIAAIGLILFFA